jgi:hypothetical protein
MPEVSIIDYTGKGSRDESWHAARLLAFTKNTRLQMNPDGFKEFEDMPVQSIAEEIAYMATTIPSSWEFVDVTFLMTDLSRATAQQVTRTRTASFAMQSQRVTEMSGVTWTLLLGMMKLPKTGFDLAMEDQVKSYKHLIDVYDVTLEDARDLLPIGVHCNLVAKYNLRTIAELVQKRKSIRVQGPYRDIVVQNGSSGQGNLALVGSLLQAEERGGRSVCWRRWPRSLRKLERCTRGPAGQIAKAIDLLK